MKLAYQITLDVDDHPERAEFLTKVQKKLGNLTFVADLEANESAARKALGVTSTDDAALSKAGYKKIMSAKGSDLWWNDQKKTGIAYIGGGDFGQWVLKEEEDILKLLVNYLFEGWRKSNSGFITDMSEISGHLKGNQKDLHPVKGAPIRCPSCRKPLDLKNTIIDKNATHDGEGELLQWKFKCDACEANLTVFND